MARGTASMLLLAYHLALRGCGPTPAPADLTEETNSPKIDPGIEAHAVVQAGALAQPGSDQPACGVIACNDDEYCEAAEEPPACRPVLLPGMPCAHTYQCAAWTYCDTSLDPPQCRKSPDKNGDCEATGGLCAEGFFCDTVHSPAKCREPKGEGEPCGLDAGCAHGLYCDFQRVKHVCTPITGPQCDPSSEGQCAPDRFCSGDHDPALCLLRGGKGALCEDDSMCSEGLHCTLNPTTNRKICKGGQ